METTLLHPEEPQASNSREEIVTSTEVTGEPVSEPDAAAEETHEDALPGVTPEQTFDVDGEKLTISEIKRLRENYKNDSKWKDENRRKSEELNTQRKELATLELLKPIIEQRPDILQQLFTPKQNHETDLQSHLKLEPDATQDWAGWRAWNLQREEISEKLRDERVLSRYRSENQDREAKEHNLQLENVAVEKYINTGKATREDLVAMADFVQKNIRENTGRYPENSFDIAYHVLYGDKEIRLAKLDATASLTNSIERAKPADSVNGENKREIPSLEDKDDNDFVSRIGQKVW